MKKIKNTTTCRNHFDSKSRTLSHRNLWYGDSTV